MLHVRDIFLTFDRPILRSINLTISEGDIIGIVGKSGAGKTSLLKIIAGLLDPTSGTVEFEGKKVLGPSVKLVPGHPEIQLVNQDFQLDIYHTVEENIREKILYLPLKERNYMVNDLLALMELMDMRDQKAVTLSGGEQQRLAIARALACEPKVLLLDEPFVHLDGRLRSKLINYLLELRNVRGTSLVLVSHDGSEMLSLSDSILSMKNGVITRKGKPKDFYYKSKSLEDAKLFGAINSINLNGKRIIFRPDEYTLDETSEKSRSSRSAELAEVSLPRCNVEFDHHLFTGALYENYFRTIKNEKIVLYSFNSLENVEKIEIKKKS